MCKLKVCNYIYITFCCLNTEKYSLQGVPTPYVKKKMAYDRYKTCLLEEKNAAADYWRITSKGHEVKFVKQHKSALSCFDDKKYLLSCKLHSLPYGSSLIKKYDKKECPFCRKNRKLNRETMKR